MGDFVGSVRAVNVASFFGTADIEVAGNLDANFTIFDDVWAESGTSTGGGGTPLRPFRIVGAFPANRTINIGGRLRGIEETGWLGGLKFVSAGSLAGQIIINADNADATGWRGAVEVSSLTLNPFPSPNDEYAATSASLGGGSIGLVPYALHDEDCAPTSASDINPALVLQSRFAHITGTFGSTTFSSSDFQKLRLSFYGPLRDDGGLPQIEMNVPNTSNWDVIPSERFHFEVHPSTGTTRDIDIWAGSNGFPNNRYGLAIPSGLYRVTGGTLKCAGTNLTGSSIPLVRAFTYHFRVEPDCNFDKVPDSTPCSTGSIVGCIADCDDGSSTGTPDDGVDINDLVYYLQLFEAGVVAADIDDGSADGAPDGGVDINDLVYFLVHFEAGC